MFREEPNDALDKDYAERLANWRCSKGSDSGKCPFCGNCPAPEARKDPIGYRTDRLVCRRCGRLEMMERSRAPQPGDKELDPTIPDAIPPHGGIPKECGVCHGKSVKSVGEVSVGSFSRCFRPGLRCHGVRSLVNYGPTAEPPRYQRPTMNMAKDAIVLDGCTQQNWGRDYAIPTSLHERGNQRKIEGNWEEGWITIDASGKEKKYTRKGVVGDTEDLRYLRSVEQAL